MNNDSSVDLGSGVHLDVPLETKRVILGTGNQKCKPSNRPDKSQMPSNPSPVSVTQVDGIEIRVERTVLRYERLEEVFDDLPEFVQELLVEKLA